MLLACNRKQESQNDSIENELVNDSLGSTPKHPVNAPVAALTESFATVKVAPNKNISFYTHTPAIVSEIHVLPGQRIKKGDALYQLESMQLIEMQREYQMALAREKTAQLEMERFKNLKVNQSVSDKNYELTEEAFITAQSQTSALAQMLNLNGIDAAKVKSGAIQPKVTKYSPASGFVNTVLVNLGERVEGNKTILTIIDASSVYLEINVQAALAKDLSIGNVFEFRNIAEEKWLMGKIELISGAINELNNTILIHGIPENGNNLKIGERVLVKFSSEERIINQ